jgi:hypothetical protein
LQRVVYTGASHFADHPRRIRKESWKGVELVTAVTVKETTPALSTVKGS